MKPSSISNSERSALAPDPWLAAALGLLVMAEVALRLFGPGELRPVRDGYYPPPQIFDREVGYRYRSSHRSQYVRRDFDSEMVTNEWGFHAPNWSRGKPAATLRLAIVGDSLLAANQVAVAQTWPALLEARLSPVAGRRVEVLNFGVDGYRAWNIARLTERDVLDFAPDLIVLWGDYEYLLNPYELYRTTVGDRIYAGYDPEVLLETARRERQLAVSIGQLLTRYSRLSQLLVRASGKQVTEGRQYQVLPGRSPRVHELEELLAVMARAARSRGVPLALFWRNRRPPVDRDPSLRLGLSSVTDAELFPVYTGLTWPSDPHFDPAGNARYAAAVAPIFQALLESTLGRTAALTQ